MTAPGRQETFYCDTMLGRLARWLRLLGYDAAYDARIEDWELLRRCRRQGRVLLTRDKRILKRWQVGRGWVRAVLIGGDRVEEQIRELDIAIGLSPAGIALCPVCNRPLENLSREAARERVPRYVYETQTRFNACNTCGRVYWKATHWREIEKVRSSLKRF